MINLKLKHPTYMLGGVALLGLQACAAGKVADAAVSTTVFASKTVVRGTVGAGKLVYKGGKAVTNIGSGRTTDQAYSGGPSGATPPSCLERDGSYSAASIDANGDYYCPG